MAPERAPERAAGGAAAGEGPAGENTVRLVGRVASRGEPRILPSGDTVVTLRVVVPRPVRRGAARAGVDTIDVACWSAASRRAAARLALEDRVEVEGALRRRFFRSAGTVASRYEVEVCHLRRVQPG